MFGKSKAIAVLLLVYIKYAKSFKNFDPKKYCIKEKELCGNGRRHIYCYPEQLVPEAKLVQTCPVTEEFKKLVLEYHNYYRNQFAMGNVTDKDGAFYYPAAKMREMIWDNELMFLASLNVKRCVMDHDQCRNTIRFYKVGQNLYTEFFHNKKAKRPPEMVIKLAIDSWFNEHKLNTKDEMASPFVLSKNFHATGHFVTLMLELADRVACRMSQCDEKIGRHQYIACDYSFTNIVGATPYTKGPPRSKCGDWGNNGVSESYSALCAKTLDKKPMDYYLDVDAAEDGDSSGNIGDYDTDEDYIGTTTINFVKKYLFVLTVICYII